MRIKVRRLLKGAGGKEHLSNPTDGPLDAGICDYPMEGHSNAARDAYSQIAGRKWMVLLLSILAIFAMFVILIMMGSLKLSPMEVLAAILYPDSLSPGVRVVIWGDGGRLVVAVMAVTVGLALGAAGAEMQTILDNPLADPYTLGISSAAAFGAGVFIVMGVGIPSIGIYAIPLNAFVLSMVSCLVIYAMARKKAADKTVMILTGIALMFLFQALVSMVQYSGNAQQASAVLFWMFGSLSRATWENVAMVIVVLASVLIFFILNSWRLTSLKLGDTKAQSLGVNVGKLRRNVLLGVSLLTATAVSFTGTIGFVGLVGPHMARMIVGDDQRYFLPFSALMGAIMLLAAAIICKLISPSASYPIGIVTSLIGVPFFMMLILRKKGALF